MLPAGERHSLLTLAAATQQTQDFSQKAKQQQGPNVSLLSPKLQQQWDHAKNVHLGNINITPHSNRKVHWICHDCPDGHPHQWEALVRSRTANDGCPLCTGQRVCKHNSVATKAPDVAATWDSTANDGTPHDFTANSTFKKQWHCLVCGHKWLARIGSRIAKQDGCPKCARLSFSRQHPVRHPTLAGCNHPLLKDWDSEANAKEGLFPDKLTLGSSKRVHWVCHKCPLGLTHKYVSVVNSRTLAGHGCPCCSGRTACECNSLLSLYPEIAQEWDFCKNSGRPDDYAAQSNAVVWWMSKDQHSWQQTIMSRTDNRLKRYKNREA